MRKLILFFAIFGFIRALAVAQENPLNKLSFLTESDWNETGTWIQNGREFDQKLSGEWALNNKIIKLYTEGVINMETGERGLRNEGIFAYDSHSEQLKYYVFDVYGGLAEADVIFDENTIHIKYEVPIQGELTNLRDSWTRVSDGKFNYEIFMTNEDGEEVKLLEGEVNKLD